jgi:hypothetical protein
MNDVNTPQPMRQRGFRAIVSVLAGCVFVAATLAALALGGCNRNGSNDEPPPVTLAESKDLPQRVHTFCGACHPYPPADTFPRSVWKDQVERGYMLFNRSGYAMIPPSIEEVVKYYEARAPEKLPPADIKRADHPLPVNFLRKDYPVYSGWPDVSAPHVSNVNLVHLTDDKKFDVLACDMQGGAVMLLRPYVANPKWEVLYGTGMDKGFNPAHTEIVDLDGDGIKDILVANLGSYLPTDRLCGSVIWLRGLGDNKYEPITLMDKVGRVADVQFADFNGDKKLDLIVAAFGWNNVGEIYYLENLTKKGEKPSAKTFKKNIVDTRHGAIHVPIADLNGDGKPDFVALISQEHETVVAFINRGGGNFEKQTLYKASHPGYGSSGIQLVDLNGDGKLDVLYTNGDVLDKPYLLKPYHSIQWLENVTDDKNKENLKFVHHHLTPMYGVHRAVAADFDGDGDLDIVAVCFLPAESFKEREEQKLDSVILLEQTKPGVFERHSLETGTCDHVTCTVGDVFGSGKPDIVTGNFVSNKIENALTIWRNQGKKR